MDKHKLILFNLFCFLFDLLLGIVFLFSYFDFLFEHNYPGKGMVSYVNNNPIVVVFVIVLIIMGLNYAMKTMNRYKKWSRQIKEDKNNSQIMSMFGGLLSESENKYFLGPSFVYKQSLLLFIAVSLLGSLHLLYFSIQSEFSLAELALFVFRLLGCSAGYAICNYHIFNCKRSYSIMKKINGFQLSETGDTV